MFQPAQLLTTLMNRVTPSGSKQLEFSPGQVLKGTVLKLYPDQMALVQIGGAQVHVRLETNLEAGQKAWLQVQPTSHPISFKVLASHEGSHQTQDASLEGLIRSLGLADSNETREVVQALIREGQPVTREVVDAYVKLAKTHGGSDQLLQAFLFAQKRSLPLSKDVVLALKAFFSSASLSDSIQAFLNQADAFASQRQGQNGPLVQLVTSLRQQLLTLPLSLPSPVQLSSDTGSLPPTLSTAPSGQTSGTGTTAQTAIGGNTQLHTQPPLPGQQSVQSIVPNQAAGGRDGGIQWGGAVRSPQGSIAVILPSGSASVQQPLGQVSHSPTAFHPQGDMSTAGFDPTLPPADQQRSAGGSSQAAATGTVSAVSAEGGKSPNNNGMSAPATSVVARSEAQLTASIFAGRLPDDGAEQPANQHGRADAQSAGRTSAAAGSPLAGWNTANDAAGELALSRGNTSASQSGNSLSEAAARSSVTASDDKTFPIRDFLQKVGLMHERQIASLRFHEAGHPAAEQRIESVKSMLLQLTQSHSSSLPKGMVDAAETLLQQVTGQQLMLLSPQHQALSQLVLQLPLRTDHGEETAFIQIESKKKESGELDPENCRLFFNLDLNRLGITMLDVNIVNRIINVNIYNDQPWLDDLVHQLRGPFIEQMRDAGYQLSGLRVQPLPEERQQVKTSTGARLPTSYRGVDIRV
ncbi:hypothetical protein LOK74_06225 [Brevibacillus humidisoli]|uniref:hypothetical protein n=1 Tax=Brevibacillus humidisoli TaxID=2895522 RepID=UPI001E32F97E|nr:hypothetical protein [Brevibacillus humidisoli]UFJ42092.1 hypothetical protein LOK74_06225 [Brevibacillus humidisoli]